MNPDLKESLPREILEELMEEGTEAFRNVLEKLFNLAMEMERSEFLGAGPYQRTEERRDNANGFKGKTVATRVGHLKLKIPQVRNLSFYPKSLERGCRSEKALKLAIAEMYVKGVSTRKVSQITEQLCGTEISATRVSRIAKLLDTELEQFRGTGAPGIPGGIPGCPLREGESQRYGPGPGHLKSPGSEPLGKARGSGSLRHTQRSGGPLEGVFASSPKTRTPGSRTGGQ